MGIVKPFILLRGRDDFYDIYHVTEKGERPLGPISRDLEQTARWFYNAEGLQVETDGR